MNDIVIRRIQSQYDHLEQEYRQTCIEVLRNSNTRASGKVINLIQSTLLLAK